MTSHHVSTLVWFRMDQMRGSRLDEANYQVTCCQHEQTRDESLRLIESSRMRDFWQGSSREFLLMVVQWSENYSCQTNGTTWRVDWLTLTRHLKTQKKMRVVKVCKQLKCVSGCQPNQLFKKLLETLRRQIQFKSHNHNITTKDDFLSSPRAGKRHLEVSSATLESISPFFLYLLTLSFVKTKMKLVDWYDMMRSP